MAGGAADSLPADREALAAGTASGAPRPAGGGVLAQRGPAHDVQPGRREAGSGAAWRGGPRPQAWLIAVAAGLAELAIGGYRIGVPSLWRDEAATIAGSSRPPGAILAMLANQDVVHGPYYLLMHVVVAAGGTSATVLRLPSLAAMCLTAALTAVLGRRLARAAGLPAPSATGLLAGLLLVALPVTTRYAQEARPYALTSLCAVLASYLLVLAAQRRGWTWWAGYAGAVALAGAFSLFALLILVAHGASLIAARAARPRGRASGRRDDWADGLPPGVLARWLAAAVTAMVVLSPMIILGAAQRSQLDWVTRPGIGSLARLASSFAGLALLIPVVAGLALAGATAGPGMRPGRGLTLAVVALPWLVLPSALLIAASLLRPVFVERYVVFCLPALSLLCAAGLPRLVQLAGATRAGARSGWLAAAPSALIVAVIAAALAGPQQAVRLETSRPDNLLAVAGVVAAHERPGDAIVYLPWVASLSGVAYPGPFRRLRNAELGVSPVASATLRGVPVPARALPARLAESSRVWAVQYAGGQPGAGWSGSDRAAAALASRMRLIRRWQIGSVLLSLYGHG